MRLRIGTRRSALALAQARDVAAGLVSLGVESEIVPIVTSGDRGVQPTDSSAGVKGLFVAEIVRALHTGDVDVAVHSAKDLPSCDPEGIIVGAVPERAAPFDVLVTRGDGLEDGAVVGTSSLRRQALLRRSRPGIAVRDIRGNVDTRLRKLQAGEVDGLVLASAGLARLGIAPRFAVPLPLEEMVPAPGQGALAVQVRADRRDVVEIVEGLNHPASRVAFEAERAVVALLGGGCALPLGAYAEQRDDAVRLLAVVVRPDGTDLVWAQCEAADPRAAAREAARILVAGGADAILAGVRGTG
jgi:hydroxymethylbilane synthase